LTLLSPSGALAAAFLAAGAFFAWRGWGFKPCQYNIGYRGGAGEQGVSYDGEWAAVYSASALLPRARSA
jgi:hypothetical protein